MELTERQKNEIAYHRDHAKQKASVLNKPFSYSVLDKPSSRWWNAYWSMYAYIVEQNLQGKKCISRWLWIWR